jgi:hypothetical protein
MGQFRWIRFDRIMTLSVRGRRIRPCGISLWSPIACNEHQGKSGRGDVNHAIISHLVARDGDDRFLALTYMRFRMVSLRMVEAIP